MPFWGAAVLFILAVAGIIVGARCLRQEKTLRTVCVIVCSLLAAASAAYMLLIIILVNGVR